MALGTSYWAPKVITAGVMGIGAIERKFLVKWRKVIEIFLPGFLPFLALP